MDGLSIDASRFSLEGTCADAAGEAVNRRPRALTRTGFPVDSTAARLVDVLHRPTESAFQRFDWRKHARGGSPHDRVRQERQ